MVEVPTTLKCCWDLRLWDVMWVLQPHGLSHWCLLWVLLPILLYFLSLSEIACACVL